MNSEQLAFSIDEIVRRRLLPVSRNHLFNMAKSGELPTVRFGRRLLVPRHALLELLQSARRQPVAPASE